MQLPYIQLPQSRAPEIIGDMGNTLVEAARRKQEAEQQAAQLLMQQQRLAADEARMRAEEHRAAAQEERAMSAEKRNADAVERQQRLEAAQFIQQAPGMLDPKAPGYNPSLFQALGQVHGANYSLQQPNLPPTVGNPGAAPQEPQSPMVGPLETPEGARNRAVSENVAGAGQGQQMQQPDAAMQEAMKQQAERDQYQQALAAHPDLVKQHAEQVNQFKAYQAAKAQADANPVYNLHTPFGDSQLDFGQRHQAEAESQQRQAAAASSGFGDTAGKAVSGAAGIGVTDPVQLAKIAQDEQRREADRAAAKDLVGEKGKNALEVAALHAAERKRRAASGLAVGADGSRGAAYDAFQAAVLGGETNLGTLAAKAGIKPNQIADQTKKIKASSSPAALGFDPNLAVRDADGNVVGGAPSTRVVKPIEDRIVQYNQAISSLEQLKASGDVIPVGSPLYDKAVLAVAAVTQANASDKTTAHEAGTIKKYGLINQGAIGSVLEDLRVRQHSFLKQLTPIKSEQGDGAAAHVLTAPPPGAKPVRGPNGETGYLYPDGTVHTADGKVVK